MLSGDNVPNGSSSHKKTSDMHCETNKTALPLSRKYKVLLYIL